MKREELIKELNKKGVCIDSYSLEGGLPNEAYCLAITENGWEVYYSEGTHVYSLKNKNLSFYSRLVSHV